MNRIFTDGQLLERVWWSGPGEELVVLTNKNYTLTIREQYCGDRSEWFVECIFPSGGVEYCNMRFIEGFWFLKEE